MYQSRCGIACSSCEGKQEVNCQGCLKMKVPFWGGSCPVKDCCEQKKLNHCGNCPEFPCRMLADMGKEEGYDSAEKIARCREWAAAEEAETVASMMSLGLL